MIQLVVFLGNTGAKYANTRHNVAWLFADALPFARDLQWQQKFKGQYASIDVVKLLANANDAEKLPKKIYFLKPETFMNLSGESIIEIAQFFKIPAQDILVVHDELELAPGTVSLKWSGGLGGHNGLRSTKAVLATADFWRLRIGIGRPNHNDIAGYVLSNFSQDEQILLSQIFMPLANLLQNVLTNKPEKFLKEWSKKKLDEN